MKNEPTKIRIERMPTPQYSLRSMVILSELRLLCLRSRVVSGKVFRQLAVMRHEQKKKPLTASVALYCCFPTKVRKPGKSSNSTARALTLIRPLS